jgi:hypothetical protein
VRGDGWKRACEWFGRQLAEAEREANEEFNRILWRDPRVMTVKLRHTTRVENHNWRFEKRNGMRVAVPVACRDDGPRWLWNFVAKRWMRRYDGRWIS